MDDEGVEGESNQKNILISQKLRPKIEELLMISSIFERERERKEGR